jgi:hypothetical protein
MPSTPRLCACVHAWLAVDSRPRATIIQAFHNRGMSWGFSCHLAQSLGNNNAPQSRYLCATAQTSTVLSPPPPVGSVGSEESKKVLQGGHAATLQQTLGKRDCSQNESQNDKMDRGGISLISEMVNPPSFEGAQSTLRAHSIIHTVQMESGAGA